MSVNTNATVGDWAVFAPEYDSESGISIIPSYNPYLKIYQTQSQTLTGTCYAGIGAVGNLVAMGMQDILNGGPDTATFYDPKNDILKQHPLSFNKGLGGVAGVGDFAVFEVEDYGSTKLIAHCFNPTTEEGFELQYTGNYDPLSSPNPFAGVATVGDFAVYAPQNSPQIMAVNPITQSVRQVTHGQPRISADDGALAPYFFAGPAVVGDWAVMAGLTGNVVCYNPTTNELYTHTEELPLKEATSAQRAGSFTARFGSPTKVGNFAVFPPSRGNTILAFNPITRTQKTLNFDFEDFQSSDSTALITPENNNWFGGASTLALNVSGELKEMAIFPPSAALSPLAYDPVENVYHKFNAETNMRYLVSAAVNGECIVHYPNMADLIFKTAPDRSKYFATIKGVESNYDSTRYFRDGSELLFELNEDGTAYTLISCGVGYVGSLDIPDTYDSLPVTSIEFGAFFGCNQLTSVTIPSSITSMGVAAFQDCISLETVDIAEGITTIPLYAFFNCLNLNNITIPTSVTRVRGFAFKGCISLSLINEIISGITSIEDGTFQGCTSIQSVLIPDNITSIGAKVFENCSGLVSIDICEYVTKIGSHTFERSGLRQITIPDGVTEIECKLFNECSELTTVTIPDSVTAIGEASFRNCINMLNIEIPSNLTSIESYAFFGCSKIEQIILPSTLISIQSRAFKNCTALTAIRIPDSVTTINAQAFMGCTSLSSIISKATSAPVSNILPVGIQEEVFKNVLTTEIIIPVGATASYQTAGDGTLYAGLTIVELSISSSLEFTLNDAGTAYSMSNCPQTAVGDIVVPSTHLDLAQSSSTLPVTAIGDDAFRYCYDITTITIPDSVTDIGKSAFRGCGMTSITLGNSVTAIGDDGFRYCTSLTSINIPDSVTSIGDFAFEICYKLTSITIGNSVTSIGEEAFRNCDSLTSITIPDSVTSIGERAFQDCSNLESATLSNNSSFLRVSNMLFLNCRKLDSITIGNSVTSIGENAFTNCPLLSAIVIPDSVTSIEKRAFYLNQQFSSTYTGFGLTSITLSNSLTSIGEEAFINQRFFTSITIPATLTNLSSLAFKACGSLLSIVFLGDSAPVVDFVPVDSRFPASTTQSPFDQFFFIPKASTYQSLSIYNRSSSDVRSTTVLTVPEGAIPSYVSTANGGGDGSTTYGGLEVVSVAGVSDITFTLNDDGTAYTITDCLRTAAGALTIPSTHLDTAQSASTLPVTVIGEDAFNNCSFLSSVIIPSSVTKIIKGAFRQCNSLISITIPNSVTEIGLYAFDNCPGLTSITIPDSVTELGTFTTTSGSIARGAVFTDCRSLVSVTLGSGITRLESGMFRDCISLTSITIPSNITYLGTGVFTGCSSLTSLIIPNSVTSEIREIVVNCTDLTSITIGTGVPTVRQPFFANPNLTTINFLPTSAPQILSSALFTDIGTTSINVPVGALSSYIDIANGGDGSTKYGGLTVVEDATL